MTLYLPEKGNLDPHLLPRSLVLQREKRVRKMMKKKKMIRMKSWTWKNSRLLLILMFGKMKSEEAS